MSRIIDVELLAPAPAPVARPEPQMPSACASGGCGGSPAPPRPPAPSFAPVRVNGVELAPEAIAREMQHHPAASLEASWRAAARALAIRELLLQEARRRGLVPEPETDDGKAEAEDDALVRALMDQAVVPEAPTEAECRRVYEAAPARFRTPDLFEAAHILIEPRTPDDAGWREARSRARALIEQVGHDRARFAECAREVSACPSAQQDGSLGQIQRGDLVPALQEALEALEPGTVAAEPVQSRFGWHVLRLERRIEGRVLPFEMVRARIADLLEARAWATASQRFIDALVRAADVEGIDLEPGAAP
ncbi:MAG: peptidylprolyl isomerase [Pseudomonadota bacterium]